MRYANNLLFICQKLKLIILLINLVVVVNKNWIVINWISQRHLDLEIILIRILRKQPPKNY